MAKDTREACEQVIVDFCDFKLTPIFDGLASPFESLPRALLKGKPLAAALSLLGSKDKHEIKRANGFKLILRKAKDGVVTVQRA